VTAGVERLKGPREGMGHHEGMMGGKGRGHGPRP